MLDRGSRFVAKKLKQFAAVDVLYIRGNVVLAIRATRGQTRAELSDADGFTVSMENRDYLVDVIELVAEQPIEPERGDMIIDDGQQYEVMPIGQNCWRWSDRGHTRRRIHCRWIGPNPDPEEEA